MSAINRHEEKLFGCLVDGFRENTKTVYLFHRCFWHWCRKCNGSI